MYLQDVSEKAQNAINILFTIMFILGTICIK